ncbi:MAG: hypothetical protein KKF58_02590 [Gammaproteobacteria bacterium]|nr:hypothetical protein [Gammaproteobacteria bacterium]MBU1447177.1 hypothetical protein [Gammaproteobacteria bacterium]
MLLLTFLPAISHAAPCKPQFEGAFWAEKDLRIVGLDAAYSACPSWFSGVRVGASYFADERFEYKGVTSSVRLQYGEHVSPFIGVGVLVGMASHQADATQDKLDNNRNGQIDEPGETYMKHEFSAVLYPEVGIAWYTRVIGIALSARRYYSSTFSGNIIYSLGFSTPLD